MQTGQLSEKASPAQPRTFAYVSQRDKSITYEPDVPLYIPLTI